MKICVSFVTKCPGYLMQTLKFFFLPGFVSDLLKFGSCRCRKDLEVLDVVGVIKALSWYLRDPKISSLFCIRPDCRSCDKNYIFVLTMRFMLLNSSEWTHKLDNS